MSNEHQMKRPLMPSMLQNLKLAQIKPRDYSLLPCAAATRSATAQ
jgi:hypothetical protein